MMSIKNKNILIEKNIMIPYQKCKNLGNFLEFVSQTQIILMNILIT